ncbi:cell wall metabolism sensor histidine kinase WalK [Intrasporangium sp.]|uniref:sensor histidine kinase n=1 Tax=Intrasporangium sp. TaxID=1925024 RepID=UPI00264741E6|nr:HAMP domain-containing sensor histidine kinase [Intrasporangium sp.]
MSLALALALAGLVALVSAVLFSRADATLADELTHEAAKLRTYAASALDPATGKPYEDVDAFLAAFLRTNVPDFDETFFSVVDGAAAQRSPFPPPTRLDLDPAIVEWAAAAHEPGTRVVPTAVGPVHLAAIPVQVEADPREAALVIGVFARGERQTARDTTVLLALSAGAALLLASGASWFVAGRILAPIRLVRSTAQQISESDLSRRIDVRGDDDVAALARTFNSMLDRLEAAFTGQRAFLHDIGHELRTPLTIVRGHLELMSDDPDELEETRGLVLDEIDRMHRLVDDLTTLAASEEPGFVRLGLVDAAHLTIEVVAKARPLGDRRWLVDHLAETDFPGDEHRLTQALMQLIANAMKHTSDGQTIAVGSSVAGDRIRLWVRDEGTGVPREEMSRIFERHTRGAGESGRSGSGLGLAIVTSIAQGHNGRVELTSAPGAGATFTLELPLGAVATYPRLALPTQPAPAVTQPLPVEDSRAEHRQEQP